MSTALTSRPIAGRLVVRAAWSRRPACTHAAQLLGGQVFALCGFVRPAGQRRHLWVRSTLVPVSCSVCLARQ